MGAKVAPPPSSSKRGKSPAAKEDKAKRVKAAKKALNQGPELPEVKEEYEDLVKEISKCAPRIWRKVVSLRVRRIVRGETTELCLREMGVKKLSDSLADLQLLGLARLYVDLHLIDKLPIELGERQRNEAGELTNPDELVRVLVRDAKATSTEAEGSKHQHVLFVGAPAQPSAPEPEGKDAKGAKGGDEAPKKKSFFGRKR